METNKKILNTYGVLCLVVFIFYKPVEPIGSKDKMYLSLRSVGFQPCVFNGSKSKMYLPLRSVGFQLYAANCYNVEIIV